MAKPSADSDKDLSMQSSTTCMGLTSPNSSIQIVNAYISKPAGLKRQTAATSSKKQQQLSLSLNCSKLPMPSP
jgi:beta-lactamase class D